VVFVRPARLGGRSALWVVNQKRRARRLITAPRNVVNPAWSPDGRRIAFNDDRDHLFVAPANSRGSRSASARPDCSAVRRAGRQMGIASRSSP
jgi:Tol biopolymer transport system component